MADNYQSRITAVEERKNNDWQNAMKMFSAAAAAKASPDTMVGLALGNILSKYLLNKDASIDPKPTKPEAANIAPNGSFNTVGASKQSMTMGDGSQVVIDRLSGGNTGDIAAYEYKAPTGGMVQIGGLLGDAEKLRKNPTVVTMGG